YPNNTMVVLLNAPKEMHPEPRMICWSRSNSSSRVQRAILTSAHVPFPACGWGTYIVTCPVAAEPTSFALGDVREGAENVEIPFRRAVDRRLDVVTCYSPLFYVDQWQPLVAALEIYRHFGASLQVLYVESMLNAIVQFLR
ncbi:Protein F49C12.5 b, partial [Aphelenchoides avenae]